MQVKLIYFEDLLITGNRVELIGTIKLISTLIATTVEVNLTFIMFTVWKKPNCRKCKNYKMFIESISKPEQKSVNQCLSDLHFLTNFI